VRPPWGSAGMMNCCEAGALKRVLTWPPQGGWRVGRGFAAPSAEECTMNRAPTSVRPAANDDIENPYPNFRRAVSCIYQSIKGVVTHEGFIKTTQCP
jgi:hypothetical protein